MRKTIAVCVALVAFLGIGLGCDAAGGGSGGTAVSFVGTWLDTVSANESYTYAYAADKTFLYTWVMSAGGTTKYKGTYSYDTSTGKYTEIVTDQDSGGGWVSGGWTTNYNYTLNGNTLHFDDGGSYSVNFTKTN